jgi:hypothetical protein
MAGVCEGIAEAVGGWPVKIKVPDAFQPSPMNT